MIMICIIFNIITMAIDYETSGAKFTLVNYNIIIFNLLHFFNINIIL